MPFTLRGSGEVGDSGAPRGLPFLDAIHRRRRGGQIVVPGTASALVRSIPAVSPIESVGAVHEALRRASAGALCLAFGGRPVGVLLLSDLDRALAHLAPQHVAELVNEPLSVLLDGPEPMLAAIGAPQVRRAEPAAAIRAALDDRSSSPLAIMVDEREVYAGIVLRNDLMAAELGMLAPPRMGGMATPLGVYLTDGTEGGGAGFLGLMLTGATMSLLLAVASLGTQAALTYAVPDLRHRLVHALSMAFLQVSPGDIRGMADDLLTVLRIPAFLVLLRLLPLAGYHAAEHQTVHCVERGLPLTVESVSRMPRAHPRCGTNLVAAVGIFGLALEGFYGMLGSLLSAVLPSLIVTLAVWRPAGTLLQNWLTTRPASRRQIESGITAARQVMQRYAERGIDRTPIMWQRIWNAGLVQVLTGAYAAIGLLELAGVVWPALGRQLSSLGF